VWAYTEEVTGEAAEDDAEKTKKSGDEDKPDSKKDQKVPESWWEYAKYEIIGLSRPDEVDSKKAEDEKDSDALKAKAAQDPDNVFTISIRRMGRSKKSQKDAGTNAIEKQGDADSNSGSDDAVLVSNDAKDIVTEGPTRRTRSKKA